MLLEIFSAECLLHAALKARAPRRLYCLRSDVIEDIFPYFMKNLRVKGN